MSSCGTGKEAIIQAVAENDTIVILGETGSGKTTQVPQFLLSSSTRVCITQPRRVAAISLATRVAQEVGCKLGKEVGYTVRFDDMSDPQRTKCKFVTDGTLLQELLADELLDRYDVVIVDEAHERTLRTDMVLGFLKKVQRLRKARKEEGKTELKIIVMSATLDAERFSEFFDGYVNYPLCCSSAWLRCFRTEQRSSTSRAVNTKSKSSTQQKRRPTTWMQH